MNIQEMSLRNNLNDRGIMALDKEQTDYLWKEIDRLDSHKRANVTRYIDESLRNNDFDVQTLLNRVNLSKLLIRAKSCV